MQNNRYKVILSERASEMLLKHIRFMANVSISAAKNLKGGIMKAVQEIVNMPNSNPWLIDEYIPKYKYRKKLVEKRYLLIYQVKDDTVYIEYILDCRQDFNWLA